MQGRKSKGKRLYLCHGWVSNLFFNKSLKNKSYKTFESRHKKNRENYKYHSDRLIIRNFSLDVNQQRLKMKLIDGKIRRFE